MIELNTTYPLDNIFVLARRLDIVQAQPPAPLPRHWDRDGPVKDHQPLPAPKRDHGAHSTAPAHSWDWRSKGT
jgi:hypothetical protein